MNDVQDTTVGIPYIDMCFDSSTYKWATKTPSEAHHNDCAFEF